LHKIIQLQVSYPKFILSSFTIEIMIKEIINIDKTLFKLINQHFVNDFLDAIMPFIREKLIWIPLYLFLLVYIIINFPKKSLPWIIGIALTPTFTDLISSRLIKPYYDRIRPCNDPTLFDTIRILVNHCGQNGSFTSSHAANHFGIAMFIWITMKNVWGNYVSVFFVWAGLISYAQVYVGVHFPMDVLGGALLGCGIGWLTGTFFMTKYKSILVQTF
jgi:undecaprenyl-diphosphatase